MEEFRVHVVTESETRSPNQLEITFIFYDSSESFGRGLAFLGHWMNPLGESKRPLKIDL